MRRTTIITVRTLIVLLLGAAGFDLKIPGRSRDRVRIHLVDRSDSVDPVTVRGPAESLRPSDADDIIASDRARQSSGDVITWASFGRNIAFESKSVDASGTDLAGALTALLGRNPTEIILYTDGRADPGNALFLCRERQVPVHVFPTGPTSVQDVRIVRIEAPTDGLPGVPVSVAVTVESTYAVKAGVKVEAEVQEAELTPGVPTRLSFTLPKPGKFSVDLEVRDDCEQNNHARAEVFVRSDQRRILALSSRFPELPGITITRATTLETPEAFDVVILDDTPLPPPQQ